MKIEKTECSYQVTECDLKFGEQITLDGELLIPISVLDNIRAEVEKLKLEGNLQNVFVGIHNSIVGSALRIIDEYKAEQEGKE